MAEEVAQEVAQEEEPPRQREFLDLFHHRALSFFHRARAKHDLSGGALSDQSDDWSRRLLALLGRDRLPAAGGDVDVPPWRLLRFAPLLAERAVTASALGACLADVLADDLRGAAVAIEQFVGTWVELAPDERTRLGVAATELGRSLVLGTRVFDRAGRFRVVVGPLDAEGYARFSAPGPAAAIRRTVRALAGEALDVEVVLRLAPHAAPGCALSSAGRFRLGQNTWIGRPSRETRVALDANGGTT
jgi:type VI secretion system protein ImpH